MHIEILCAEEYNITRNRKQTERVFYMTARQYARSKGFKVAGKLTYKGITRFFNNDAGTNTLVRWWTDEHMNEYWLGKDGKWNIVTSDGSVL